MKLGDKMTMEAYNVWGNVPPRKCRPPRIGDIPKHSAVDEESPGSSTRKLTISPSEAQDATVELPLDSAKNIVFPLDAASSTDSFPTVRKYEARKPTFLYSEKEVPRHAGKEPRNTLALQRDLKPATERSIAAEHADFTSISTNPGVSKDRTSIGLVDQRSRVTIRLSSTEDSARVTINSPSDAQDGSWTASSPEDTYEQEFHEVRKDSALFLEEPEGLPALREILKTRAPRVVRPRRESSGYASNLGTFDEDRRNSSSAEALQDLSSFLKERRRSSTKRINSRIVQSLTEATADGAGQSALDRMPTTEICRKVSSAGLEMPNIEEVKEVLRDEVASGHESLDNLCGLVERISTEELSSPCRLLDTRTKPEIFGSSKPQAPPKDTFDTRSLIESVDRLAGSASNRTAYQQAVTSTSLAISQNTTWKADSDKPRHVNEQSRVKCDIERARISKEIIGDSIRDGDVFIDGQKRQTESGKVLPRSVKVYQLLSTQSEDRVDGEPRFSDRRISLQISKQDDENLPAIPSLAEADDSSTTNETANVSKNNVVRDFGLRKETSTSESTDGSPVRKLSSPCEVSTGQRFLGDVGNVTVRPIYPYCPYSPYGSPQGSPRNRRKPLRESRRVSIDNRHGALQLNQYKLLDNIGQGSYGIVKLVYNELDETHYAMKILSKKKLMKKAGIFGRMAPGRKGAANPLAKVYREIALLKKLDHPNVVKLVEVLDDPDEDNLYLVFELVQRGEVLQIPTDKPLDEDAARKNFRDVVMGVEYLHYQRIVHRDIKPSNLLVDGDGRIKIADLGVSAELRASGELLSGPAGTPAFAAPETTTPGAHYSGTPCDVWSMGVTLYSLVTGRVPWDGAGSIIGVQAAVRTEPLKFPDAPVLSHELRQLISRMLAKEPAERIGLSEIKEHGWLTNSGVEPLPREVDNCRLPVTVTDEEVERVVTKVPKLDTLILIKTMLKQHSFQNPFLPRKSSSKTSCNEAGAGSLELSASGRVGDSVAQRETIRNVKSERFQRSGRSNSAPDSYDWQANGRQISVESPLPPVTEASSQESEAERR